MGWGGPARRPGTFLRVACTRSYTARRPDPEACPDAFQLTTRGTLAHALEYLSTFPTELPTIDAGLGAIQLPCPMASGDLDPFFDVQNAQRLAAGLPQPKLEVLQGVGHLTHVDAPDRVAIPLIRSVGAPSRPARRPLRTAKEG